MPDMQQDIFGAEVPLTHMVRATDPTTSRQAAVANPLGKSRLRLAVLGVFFELPAATSDEVFDRLRSRPGGPVNQGSVRKRLGELVEWGWLRHLTDGDGEPVTRMSNSRSPMYVWCLTDHAKENGLPT